MVEKFGTAYTGCAILFTNIVLMLVCLNIAVLAYGALDDDALQSPTRVPETEALTVFEMGALTHGLDVLRPLYPGYTDVEIIRLVLESANVGFYCDDVLSYRVAPFNGEFVNVHPAGFRYAQPPPWPPDEDAYNVFFFGGSTVFGYGEADNETIPVHLEAQLRQAHPETTIHVYNFGQHAYFSLQERLLFEELAAEHDIDLAIFMDGLNEFFYWDGQPWDNPDCRAPNTVVNNLRATLRCDYGEYCLPMQQIALPQPPTPTPNPSSPPARDDLAAAQAVIDRWLANKARIETTAREHDVELLFVIQPVPVHAYDFTQMPFVEELFDFAQANRAHWAYPLWAAQYADPESDWAANALYLGDIQQGRDEILYVDRFHYTAAFMGEIAGAIAEALAARGLPET
ncbi:MAG: hypothetical protein ACLFTK_07685 [Anaerolineales bacterium]